MTEQDEDSDAILKRAKELDLDLIVVLGVSEENGSIILHNAGDDLQAGFLIKMFTATLDMSIMEEILERGRRSTH